LAQYDYNDEIDVDKLIDKADNSMYQNKSLKKNNPIQMTLQHFNEEKEPSN
jgi:GGDEF domain-containing protein